MCRLGMQLVAVVAVVALLVQRNRLATWTSVAAVGEVESMEATKKTCDRDQANDDSGLPAIRR